MLVAGCAPKAAPLTQPPNVGALEIQPFEPNLQGSIVPGMPLPIRVYRWSSAGDRVPLDMSSLDIHVEEGISGSVHLQEKSVIIFEQGDFGQGNVLFKYEHGQPKTINVAIPKAFTFAEIKQLRDLRDDLSSTRVKYGDTVEEFDEARKAWERNPIEDAQEKLKRRLVELIRMQREMSDTKLMAESQLKSMGKALAHLKTERWMMEKLLLEKGEICFLECYCQGPEKTPKLCVWHKRLIAAREKFPQVVGALEGVCAAPPENVNKAFWQLETQLETLAPEQKTEAFTLCVDLCRSCRVDILTTLSEEEQRTATLYLIAPPIEQPNLGKGGLSEDDLWKEPLKGLYYIIDAMLDP